MGPRNHSLQQRKDHAYYTHTKTNTEDLELILINFRIWLKTNVEL